MDDRSPSLFDRYISRPRDSRVTLALGILFLVLSLAVAVAGGAFAGSGSSERWIGLLIPPTITTYILAVAPFMAREDTRTVSTLRPIVLVEEEAFGRTVREATTLRPRNEVAAIVLGTVFGVLSAGVGPGTTWSWVHVYWVLASMVMYGLLAWTIYSALATSRLVSRLLSHPLRVDPLDPAPFEPIGRQSLLNSLVFVGGITISLIFTAIRPERFREWQLWAFYFPLLVVPVLVFFLTMLPTHRVMAAARQRRVDIVQSHLRRAFQDLAERLDNGQEAGDLPAEINALTAYDQRLQDARSWPYNTAMLRTLFASVFIPGATVVGRILLNLLSGGSAEAP